MNLNQQSIKWRIKHNRQRPVCDGFRTGCASNFRVHFANKACFYVWGARLIYIFVRSQAYIYWVNINSRSFIGVESVHRSLGHFWTSECRTFHSEPKLELITKHYKRIILLYSWVHWWSELQNVAPLQVNINQHHHHDRAPVQRALSIFHSGIF